MEDILQKINNEDLPTLRDVFKKNWPYNVQAYLFVDNWIAWKKKNPNVAVEFLSPNGDWSNGTFVAIVSEYIYHVFFFTLDETFDKLAHALRTTKRINWKMEPILFPIFDENKGQIMEIIKGTKQHIKFDERLGVWLAQKEKVLNLEVNYPHDIYASSLQENDAKIISSYWDYRFPGADQYLANIIKMNGGIGLYDKNTNELCCWALINDYAEIGFIQTLEHYRNRGLATELVKDYFRRRALLGRDTVATITHGNIASQRVFINAGAIIIRNTRWIGLKSHLNNHL